MQVKFIPLDFDSFDFRDKTFIRMWGRTEDGKRCCVIDQCDSYFWLIPKKNANIEKYAEKVEKVKIIHFGREVRVRKVEIKDKNFREKGIKALKVYADNPRDLMIIKDAVKHFPETEDKKEHELNYVTRYLIEKDVKPLIWHEVTGEKIDKYAGDFDFETDILIKAKEIKIS